MIRNPMHAGTFYPRFAAQLNKQIEGWLTGTTSPAQNERTLGLIIPHAGYMYSGQCAALGYHNISSELIDTFIILHPSHHGVHFDFSLSPYSEYVNPLGSLFLDKDIYQKLAPHADQEIAINLHQNEHSMEIQLPLISHFFPRAGIVPIMIGNQIPAVAQRLAELLYDVVFKSSKRIVILCSTDLSHYHKAGKAEEMDSLVLDSVLALNTEKLWQDVQNERCEACGLGGILSLMYYSRHYSNSRSKIINYTHSGKVSGNNSQVVGYLAAKVFI